MYEISVIKSAINLYRHLYDINIKGNKRINFTYYIFNKTSEMISKCI